MQGVLTDMLLAEAMVNVDYNAYKSDTMKLALYESVFRKHDITQAVYDSSLVWYGRNLDITWRSTTGSWPILINGSIT